jgi:hypothetical protein
MKNEGTLCGQSKLASARFRTQKICFLSKDMLAIRLYISALTLLFLFLSIAIRGLFLKP